MLRLDCSTSTAPKCDDGHLHQLFQQPGCRPRQSADGPDIPLAAQGAGKVILPYPAAVRFQHQRLDRAHVVQGFDQIGLPLGFGGIKRVQPAAEGRQQRPDAARNGQRKAQHHQRQRPAEQHQNAQKQGQKGGIQQGLKQPPRQKGPDLFGLLHVPRHHPGRRGFKDRQRQRQKMGKGPRPDQRIDLATRNQHKALADIGKAGVEPGQHDIDHHDGDKRVPRLMGDHPVDQHLKQQGQGKADQIAHDHRQRHPHQQPRLRPEGGQEPRQAKVLIVLARTKPWAGPERSALTMLPETRTARSIARPAPRAQGQEWRRPVPCSVRWSGSG